jgi:hypothetical protein
MNRRDILSVLGIGGGAVALGGTESITARAAEIEPNGFNDVGKLMTSVPQIDRCGPGRQIAIAEALEALAGELRQSADRQNLRNAVVKDKRERKEHLDRRQSPQILDALHVEPAMPAPENELWVQSLETRSKLDSGFLEHEIVLRVEMHHKA